LACATNNIECAKTVGNMALAAGEVLGNAFTMGAGSGLSALRRIGKKTAWVHWHSFINPVPLWHQLRLSDDVILLNQKKRSGRITSYGRNLQKPVRCGKIERTAPNLRSRRHEGGTQEVRKKHGKSNDKEGEAVRGSRCTSC
jgi:hypothetical protein